METSNSPRRGEEGWEGGNKKVGDRKVITGWGMEKVLMGGSQEWGGKWLQVR